MFNENYFSDHKERRRKHYGAKSMVRSCRNHGSCPHCRDDRTFSARRRAPVTTAEEYRV